LLLLYYLLVVRLLNQQEQMLATLVLVWQLVSPMVVVQQAATPATFGGNIQGRITTEKAPVSVRGAVLFSDETSAIMPIVTYDVPVTNNANLYVGAGYSFVESNGKPTPLGNQDAPVVTVGAEAALGNNMVVYGDTKLGINAYQNSPASAVSVQAGAGFKF
jgi:hypothetical protein